jgi:hypothetical protein
VAGDIIMENQISLKQAYIEKLRNDNIWDRKRKYWKNLAFQFYGFLANM